MREKFELACKIIGLLFFCSSIFTFLLVIVILIISTTDTMPESTKALMTQSQLAELQKLSVSTWNQYILISVLFGITEILLGLYLMRTNNMFVRFCYLSHINVQPADSSADICPEPNKKESPGKAEEPSENKYAPPGYFQNEKL